MVTLALSLKALQHWKLAFLSGPGFFWIHPLVSLSSSLGCEAVSVQPTHVISLNLTSESWVSATSPYWLQRMRLGSTVPQCWPSVQISLCFTCPLQTTWCSPRFQSSPFIQADFPASERASQGVGTCPLSQLPSWGSGPIAVPFSLSFFYFSFHFGFSCLFGMSSIGTQ